ncbi:MAG: hypothetical protein JJU02_06325 [Cryomorphaceae bacterium]|nr:hypothetical protein [Cryomorphaceae bacterium]
MNTVLLRKISMLISAALVLGTTACIQDDISDKINTGQNHDERNVVVRYNSYFNNQVISPDSTYFNIYGEALTFEEVTFLVNNFRYISDDKMDTIVMNDPENHNTFNLIDKETRIGRLPKGTYNGRIYFDIGVSDTMHKVYLMDTLNPFAQTSIPEYLENPVWFKPMIGFLSLRIRGTVRDTSQHNIDSFPPQPFEIYLGGPEHNFKLSGEANYAVNHSTEIIYILDWNMEEIFDIVEFMDEENRLIQSDSLLVDMYETAQHMRDSLNKSYFIR